MYQESHAIAEHGLRQDAACRAAQVVRWQPRFVVGAAAAAAGSLDLNKLIGTLRDGAGRLVRVAEFTQHAEPLETAVAGSLDLPGETEFWLFGATEAGTARLFEAFGLDRQARFAVADLADPATIDFSAGLLREAACDMVVVDAKTAPLTPMAWIVIRRLLVPGGLVLIRHTDKNTRVRDT